MKIIRGIKNGAVLQRDENELCSIVFEAEACGDVTSSMGCIEKLDETHYQLTGIPVGGPYALTISDAEDEVAIEKIYVGDVWILAGQSNMEGAGRRRAKEIAYDLNPNQEVRAYYLDDHWDAARSLLHQQWMNTDPGVQAKYLKIGNIATLDHFDGFRDNPEKFSGVGPGHFIALRMHELTRVPQAVIPCAMGATGMNDWTPEDVTPASLYRSMIRRAYDCGGNIRGVFWHQGEGETSPDGIKNYNDNMKLFISSIRRDLKKKDLPFVQAQIGHTTLPQCSNQETEDNWQRVRELQRKLPEIIPNVSTVSTANSYLQDLIHIDAQSHEELGRTMAEEMYRMLTGIGTKLPSVSSVKIEDHEAFYYIVVTYDNVIGSLVSDGRPYGFSVTQDDEKPYDYPYRYIDTIRLDGDKVIITVETSYTKPETASIWYGAGFACVGTIRDQAGRSLHAFGPLKLSDYINTESK